MNKDEVRKKDFLMLQSVKSIVSTITVAYEKGNISEDRFVDMIASAVFSAQQIVSGQWMNDIGAEVYGESVDMRKHQNTGVRELSEKIAEFVSNTFSGVEAYCETISKPVKEDVFSDRYNEIANVIGTNEKEVSDIVGFITAVNNMIHTADGEEAL